MTEMRIVVRRNAADVQRNLAGLHRLEQLRLTGERVVEREAAHHYFGATVAVAQTAMPPWGPNQARPSWVFPFTLTADGSKPSSRAMASRIFSRAGASFGRSA